MQHGKKQVSRRNFLKGTAAGAAVFTIASPDILGGPGRTAPNDKMGVAFIGCGGRGGAQVGGLSRGNNVVGLCDVDGRRAAGSFNRFAKELVEEIAETDELGGRKVLEIGCGKGDFLQELVQLQHQH